MIYILIFILFVFIALLTEEMDLKKNWKIFFLIIGEFIFLFISSFRYKTGMDWYNYLFEYNNLKTVNKVFSSFGYIFIEKMLIQVYFNFYYILEFSLAYFIFIKRRPESEKRYFYLFIYSSLSL